MTWEDKRKEILIRDNFTCQKCDQFNPELGVVEFAEADGQVELHEYKNHPDPSQNVYSISQSKTGYTFEINFGDCWPVFPIIQVHHRRYVNGKDRWDYNNQDLTTLCKRCHSNLHSKEKIPIYSRDDTLLEEKLFLPVDEGNGRKHMCDEWTFIKRIGGGEYVLSNIFPTITMVLFEGEDSEDAFNEGRKALDKYLSEYIRHFPVFMFKVDSELLAYVPQDSL